MSESPRRCGLGEAPADAPRRGRWVEVRGWQGFSGDITTGGFSFLRKSESHGNMQHGENKKEDTKEVSRGVSDAQALIPAPRT